MSARPLAASRIDSPYAWGRLVFSLIIGTVGGVGLWSAVVVLPTTQELFEVDRGLASLPYTVTMVGIMAGNVIMGRLVDRLGVAVPVLISAFSLGLGYVGIALAPNFWVMLFAQGLLVGAFGTSTTFGPMIAAISLWFKRYRGIAVALVACGSYTAGTVWPPLVHGMIDVLGWRDTHLVIGTSCVLVMVPLAFTLRGSPPVDAVDSGHSSDGDSSPKSLPMSHNALQCLLVFAGIACCVAMSMPQVHIVAFCVDLDLGAERGSTALSLMLGLGVISRIVFGFVMDRIGAVPTLFIGSTLQAISLLLYLPVEGVWTLYVVSALFGLFQGGIVPAYAVIIRDSFPATQAGVRVGLVLSATMAGMAAGGWMSGMIYDWTLSYDMAFLNGFTWNLLNMAIVVLLLLRGRVPRHEVSRPRIMQATIPIVGRWPGPLR
ncbi:MAG: MFS transporter [Rhodospirillaceae bacterium]|nr:MFS transporter [Rhodospirillaceae bacterium]